MNNQLERNYKKPFRCASSRGVKGVAHGIIDLYLNPVITEFVEKTGLQIDESLGKNLKCSYGCYSDIRLLDPISKYNYRYSIIMTECCVCKFQRPLVRDEFTNNFYPLFYHHPSNLLKRKNKYD